MKVSIACLIYKSIKYLEFVKKSIEENTPMLKTGDTEFYFVCNNAIDEVKNYLKDNNIPHYIFETEQQPPYPHNIGFIYKAWNFTVEKAKGDIVVLVNSDMAFSKDWLENLIKYLDKNKVITSRLVESGKIQSIFPHTITKNFGRTPETFAKDDFEMFVESVKEDKLESYGTFMPLAVYRENFMKVRGYPEGNIYTKFSDREMTISGDWSLFYFWFLINGVLHYTAMDSIVYHIQTGEVSE